MTTCKQLVVHVLRVPQPLTLISILATTNHNFYASVQCTIKTVWFIGIDIRDVLIIYNNNTSKSNLPKCNSDFIAGACVALVFCSLTLGGYYLSSVCDF